MLNKKRIGILCGGRSAEHEVSLLSANSILAAIDKEKFDAVLIGIDKTGKWRMSTESEMILDAKDAKTIRLNLDSDKVGFLLDGSGMIYNFSEKKDEMKLDAVFPVLHGTYGEDGAIQGLLKLANVPFVGAGVLGSAVGMDKDVMKRLLRDAGLPICRFISATKENVPDYNKAKANLGDIIFVKPANSGSSVGVSKTKNKEEYERAIDEAFLYDAKIIIEEYMSGKEIECSVLGNDKPSASMPAHIIVHHEFYSYEAKYFDGGMSLIIPAEMTKIKQEEVKKLAVQAFQTLSCEGLARVDMFQRENGELVINEINTLPGFTKTSVYPKLWEASGISYTDLITRLIELGFERFEKENKIKIDK